MFEPSSHKERIELKDSPLEAIVKLCEGNPGAMTVSVDLYKSAATIDPDNFLGGLGPILSLDTFGIYGSKIWILFKDICGQDLISTIAVLRAVQLGILPLSELKKLLYNEISLKNPKEWSDNILAKVKEHLPNFNS